MLLKYQNKTASFDVFERVQKSTFELFGFAFVVVCFLSSGFGYAQNDEVVFEEFKSRTEIFMQGFNWESYSHYQGGHPDGWYRNLDSFSAEISDSGFTAIWFPPPSSSFAGNGVDPHSRGYLPIEYYNLTTSYGSKDELVELISNLKRGGVRSIADIVVNHRAEKDPSNGCNFVGPNWGPWAVVSDDGSGCGQGARDEGVEIKYFADIDHSNQTVRSDITDWLRWLHRDIGFAGWRFDYVKGFPGKYVERYIRKSEAEVNIGEYWPDMKYGCSEGFCYNQDTSRQKLANWVDSTWKGTPTSFKDAPMTFDFTTKGILGEAVRSGQYWRLIDEDGHAPGFIGWWPYKAVTFIDNHDTGSSQGLWPFSNSPEQIMQGYAYILTHPGVPCVFYDHFFDWRDSQGELLRPAIKKLMSIRIENELSATSKLQILRAENDLYVAKIDDKIIIKLGYKSWSPGAEWKLATSGDRYAIWQL